MRLLLLASLALACATSAAAEDSFQPHTAFVAAERGLNVRAEARADAPVIAILWQGARVFVREDGEHFVRIDGFGVAGHAFVDKDFLSTLAPPQSRNQAPPETPNPPAR